MKKNYKIRDVHVVYRGCKASRCSENSCNWHGEFATCSPDPNSRRQRKDALKGAMDFQNARVERVETLLGFRRRRVGCGDIYGIAIDVPLAQVQLSADSALRKAIAAIRSEICVGQVPKDTKKCGSHEYHQSGSHIDYDKIRQQWLFYMAEDHDMKLAMSNDDVADKSRANIFTVQALGRNGNGGIKASYEIFRVTSSDGKTGCKIYGEWSIKLLSLCRCSPFVMVQVTPSRIAANKSKNCKAKVVRV